MEAISALCRRYQVRELARRIYQLGEGYGAKLVLSKAAGNTPEATMPDFNWTIDL